MITVTIERNGYRETWNIWPESDSEAQHVEFALKFAIRGFQAAYDRSEREMYRKGVEADKAEWTAKRKQQQTMTTGKEPEEE